MRSQWLVEYRENRNNFWNKRPHENSGLVWAEDAWGALKASNELQPLNLQYQYRVSYVPANVVPQVFRYTKIDALHGWELE